MKYRILSVFLAILMLFSLLPVTTAAVAESAILTVEQVYANPDKDVTVKITIEGNPGILGATLTLSWDDGLELVGAENGAAFSALTMTPPSRYVSGCNFVWFGSETGNIIDDTVLILTFHVSKTAKDEKNYGIFVTYESGDVLDGNYNPVEFLIENGSVRVINYLPCDVTGDWKINAMDLVRLSQYISDGCKTDPKGYNVSINESAADVNDDEKINALDLVLISRYISDGCKTDPTGYNITPKPATPKCSHTMREVPYQAATCTTAGNLSYWYCTTCEKCFTAADGKTELSRSKTVLPATGHTPVTDPAVPPTTSTEGKTEGSHCSVCGAIIVPQTTIPPTQAKTHSVSYDIANGDPYLEKLLANGQLSNSNPQFYEEGIGLKPDNPDVPGYRFLDWHDLPKNGALIKKIDATATEDYVLYAYWDKIQYTVQYKSDVTLERTSDTYTVDTGLVLLNPRNDEQLINYTFVGWTDENGELYTKDIIPVGTTEHIILEANWISERNKTWTKPVLDEPIVEIDEESNTILFAYEIGEIQNVPLYTIKDWGRISGGSPARTETFRYSTTLTDTQMKSVSSTIAKATTESSNWVLSNSWNESTSINEEWCNENGKQVEEAETFAKSSSDNWNISNGISGSTISTTLQTNQNGWKNEAKINASKEKSSSSTETNKDTTSDAWNITGKMTYTPKSFSLGIGDVSAGTSGGLGGEFGGGYEHTWGNEHTTSETESKAQKKGMEVGGSIDSSELITTSTENQSSWNSSSSYGGSNTSSSSTAISSSLSQRISQIYGYGKNLSLGGGESSSQGLSSTQTNSESYSSSVTYSTATSQESTITWTTQGAKSGYHRLVMAGTAHVFAVVGYNMETKAYFVYTYSVMDDETHFFEDYSTTDSNFGDQQNGVISFAAPYEIADYVAELTSYSSGLKVDRMTGVITGYTGSDDCVVIPEYMNVGNGDVIKITGISRDAFRENTNIKAIVLSDFITEIPPYAFEGCTSLRGVSGGSITKIGEKAFSGCTSIEDVGIRTTVTELGTSAFKGVDRVIINVANKDVLLAAANSGAKQIILCLDSIDGGADALTGLSVTIPSGTTYFEFNGAKQTYCNFRIISEANATVINKTHLNSQNGIPLQIKSSEVIFNQSSFTASGLALVLSNESTHLGLYDTVVVTSAEGNAMICKNLSLYEVNENVVGKLVVKDNLLICGTCEPLKHLSYQSLETIDSQTFENMLHSFTVYFDTNGGECSEVSRTVANSTRIGALPTPAKEHYTFDGWFLSDGTAVTENSVFSAGTDITVYAHWTPVPYTVTWTNATGCTITVSRSASPNANATIGGLQIGDTVYFGDVLNIAYSANTGFTITSQGNTSLTVSGNITGTDIYATASPKSYTAEWSIGQGYSIAVNRTGSPYANARTGSLTSGDTVYYGDVLAITYSANTGYSITGKGSSAVTVTGNVDSNTIYATASANSYTYTIVCKSSNGTNLRSSSATYKFGTTNTITPPAISGYNTPSAQRIVWNATSKTITFTYTPTSVSSWSTSGVVQSSSPKITYSVSTSYRNRTATSVDVMFTTTVTMQSNWSGYGYGMAFKAYNGSQSTDKVILVTASNFTGGSSYTQSSSWITIPLSTTNAITLSFTGNIYNIDWNGEYQNIPNYIDSYYTWYVNIPAY